MVIIESRRDHALKKSGQDVCLSHVVVDDHIGQIHECIEVFFVCEFLGAGVESAHHGLDGTLSVRILDGGGAETPADC